MQMFCQTKITRRPPKDHFCHLWPWPFLQTPPSEGPNTSFVRIWRKSVQRFPTYLHKQNRLWYSHICAEKGR